MSPHFRRWLWRGAKLCVVAAILAGVGWTFAKNLRALDTTDLTWDATWLVLAGLAYLAGSLVSALYWWFILRELRQRPTFTGAVRAYHIGHLGKYVPGKALVPILRTAFVRGPEVRTSVTVVSVFYETLVIMAAGAILAAALASTWLGGKMEQLGVLVIVLGGAALLLAPPVFNRLARGIVGLFQKPGAEPVPPLRFRTLLVGILLGTLNWCFVGLSLWAAIRAVQPRPLDLEVLLFCTATVCLATVVGFVTPSPGGLGVREWIILELLTPALGPGPAAVVPLLLRLTMILSEVVAAGVLYLLPQVSERRASGPP